MLIDDPSLGDAYRSNRVWGNRCLDNLLRQCANEHPDQLALSDSPDKADWGGDEPKSLTFSAIETAVSRLAAFFQDAGLKEDSVIAVRSPNTAEIIISLLAIWRAGMIACVVPFSWRRRDMIENLDQVGVRAIIGSAVSYDDPDGSMLRDIAAELFKVKFVFSFGSGLPKGLIDLAPVLDDPEGRTLSDSPRRSGSPGDHVAAISWTTSRTTGPVPMPRNHNHLIAGGLQHVLGAKIQSHSKILCTYNMSGITGLTCGLATWLLTRGTLHLHRFVSLRGLGDHIDQSAADQVLIPGTIAGPLDELLADDHPTAFSAAWLLKPIISRQRIKRAFADIMQFDEMAMYVARRTDGVTASFLPLVRQNAEDAENNGDQSRLFFDAKLNLPAVGAEVTASVRGGELVVRGPIVPSAPWPRMEKRGRYNSLTWTKDGYLHTGIGCRLSHATNGSMAEPLGWLDDVLIVGNLPVPARQIDEIYQSYPLAEDAAVFCLDDNIAVGRLYAAIVPKTGTVIDASDFYKYLEGQNIASHLIPWTVVSVGCIPRGAGDIIQRVRLSEVATPKSTAA